MLFLFLGEFDFLLLKIENGHVDIVGGGGGWGELGGSDWQVRTACERRTAGGSRCVAKGAQLAARWWAGDGGGRGVGGGHRPWGLCVCL